jgi:hypothetical protein
MINRGRRFGVCFTGLSLWFLLISGNSANGADFDSLSAFLREAVPAWRKVREELESQTRIEISLKSWNPETYGAPWKAVLLLKGRKKLLYVSDDMYDGHFFMARNSKTIYGKRASEKLQGRFASADSRWLLADVGEFDGWQVLRSREDGEFRIAEAAPYCSLSADEEGVLLEELFEHEDFHAEYIGMDQGLIEVRFVWNDADKNTEKPAGLSFQRYHFWLDPERDFQIERFVGTWGKEPFLKHEFKVNTWISIGEIDLPSEISVRRVIRFKEPIDHSAVASYSYSSETVPSSEFSLTRFGLADIEEKSVFSRYLTMFVAAFAILGCFLLWKKYK